MGEGKVLESGTHDDLLQRAGHYHRLVQAQKLRESSTTTLDGESDHMSSKDMILAEDVQLTRKNTGHSLASEVIEQKRRDGTAAEADEQDLGLFQLGRRLAALIPDKHKSYYMGMVFALGKFFNNSLKSSQTCHS